MSDDGLPARAFEVKDISDDFDPKAVPATGEEYLQHVMFEASQCPQVVVANIDRSKIKNPNVKLQDQQYMSASELAPSLEWQQVQVAEFSAVRQRVGRLRKSDMFKVISLPRANSDEKWYSLFFGDDKTRMTPSLSVLLSMNEPLLTQILEYHVEWLEDGLKPDQGRWLYAILACLSLPLSLEVCSLLRDLARHCARLRNLKTSCDDGEVVVLNLLICLVSKYFGQLDLGD